MTQYTVPFQDLHRTTTATLRLIVERDKDVSFEQALFAVGSAIGIALAARAGLGQPDLDTCQKSVNLGIASSVDLAVKSITEELIRFHGGRQ